jgi:hypothetical protein
MTDSPSIELISKSHNVNRSTGVLEHERNGETKKKEPNYQNAGCLVHSTPLLQHSNTPVSSLLQYSSFYIPST